MTDRTVRAYVIGQTPRPDLTDDLASRFPSITFEIVGALDEVRGDDVGALAGHEYPLETRLRDGKRVIVDAGRVQILLQEAIDGYRGDAVAHLILCAGPFPGLAAPATPSGPPIPLIRPFDAAVEALRRRGHRRLDVLVPFAAQAGPAAAKWAAAGFTSRTHVLAERPDEVVLPAWASYLVGTGDAEALVFDYVGFPSDALSGVAARIGIPVVDVGHLALDALEEVLGAP